MKIIGKTRFFGCECQMLEVMATTSYAEIRRELKKMGYIDPKIFYFESAGEYYVDNKSCGYMPAYMRYICWWENLPGSQSPEGKGFVPEGLVFVVETKDYPRGESR